MAWLGNSSELAYFIKLVHNTKQYVMHLGKAYWQVACQCFEQANSQPYTRDQLRKKKTPVQQRYLLERLVNHLK